jgi:hypothetical protein
LCSSGFHNEKMCPKFFHVPFKKLIIHKHLLQSSNQPRGLYKRREAKKNSPLIRLLENQAAADDWRNENFDVLEEIFQTLLRNGQGRGENTFNESDQSTEYEKKNTLGHISEKRNLWTKRKTDNQDGMMMLENQTDMLRSPYSKHFQFFQDPSPLDRLELKSFVNQESLHGELNHEEIKGNNQIKPKEENEQELNGFLLKKCESSAGLELKTNPTHTAKTKKIEFMYDGGFDLRKNFKIYFPHNNSDVVLKALYPKHREKLQRSTKNKISRKINSATQKNLAKKNIIKLTSFENKILK